MPVLAKCWCCFGWLDRLVDCSSNCRWHVPETRLKSTKGASLLEHGVSAYVRLMTEAKEWRKKKTTVTGSEAGEEANFKLSPKFLRLSDTLELVFLTSATALGEPIKNNMNDIAFPPLHTQYLFTDHLLLWIDLRTMKQKKERARGSEALICALLLNVVLAILL